MKTNTAEHINDKITLDIPWGADAVFESDFSTKSSQIILLQQHIIDTFQAEQEAPVQNDVWATAAKNVELNQLRSKIGDRDSQIDSLKDENANLSLQIRKNLKKFDEISANHIASIDALKAAFEEEKQTELDELQSVIDSLNEELALAKEKVTKFNSTNQCQNSEVQHLRSENEKLERMVEKLLDKSDEFSKYAESSKIDVENLSRHNKLLTQKCAYLSEQLELANRTIVMQQVMIDYDDMAEVYKGKDGTQVYVASCNPASSIQSDSDDAKVNLDYPIFLCLRGDGVGHLAFIDSDNQLCFPEPARNAGMTIDNSIVNDVKEACLKRTIPVHKKLMNDKIETASNIAKTAHLIDFDWSEMFDLKKFCDALYDCDLSKTAEELAKISDALILVRKVSQEYKNHLTRKAKLEKTKKTTTSKKKKRK